MPGSGSSIDSMRYRAIYKLWPDFPVYSQIYRSVATIKSDAAVRSYGAGGSGIVWAVIDSGIDGTIPTLTPRTVTRSCSPEIQDLHRCFVDSEGTVPGLDIPFVAAAPLDPDALRRPDPDDSPEEHQNFRDIAQGLLDDHRNLALTDDFGHGTHVAGIIAGMARKDTEVRLLERTERSTSEASWSAGSSS